MASKEWETYIDPVKVTGGGDGTETYAFFCTICEKQGEPEEPKDTVPHESWCTVATIKKLEEVLQLFYDQDKEAEFKYWEFYQGVMTPNV